MYAMFFVPFFDKGWINYEPSVVSLKAKAVTKAAGQGV